MPTNYNPSDYAAWRAAQALCDFVALPTEAEALRTENASLRAALASFAGCLSDLQPGC